MPPGRPLQPTLVTDASWRRVAQANGRLDVRNWQIGMIGMIGMDVHVAQSIKIMFSVHVSRCILYCQAGEDPIDAGFEMEPKVAECHSMFLKDPR